MKLNGIICCLVVVSAAACTTPVPDKSKPIVKKRPPPATTPVLIPKEKSKVQDFSSDDRYRANCVAFEGELKNLPKYVRPTNALVSRFVKTCITAKGEEGYIPGSPWTALGFPCTGGKGEIDIKGNQYKPKLATFSFTNTCPMSTNNPALLEQQIRGHLPLPQDSRLIAYYPFSVVFWEFPEYGDSDVGFDLELYSPAALQMGWKNFQSQKPLYVRLYGSENSLVKSNNLYQVDGYIEKQADGFRYEVEAVKPLSEDEQRAVKEKCYALTPRRNCSQAF